MTEGVVEVYKSRKLGAKKTNLLILDRTIRDLKFTTGEILLSFSKKRPDHLGSDKTGTACNKYAHSDLLFFSDHL